MPKCRNPHRPRIRSEEHTSELQSQSNLVCRLLLEKKKKGSSSAARPRRLSGDDGGTSFPCAPGRWPRVKTVGTWLTGDDHGHPALRIPGWMAGAYFVDRAFFFDCRAPPGDDLSSLPGLGAS